jgi:peroxiredoxin
MVLVSRGDAGVHRRWAEEHHWRCEVLFDEDWNLANAYGATGTPMGYLIDESGKIASDLAAGADAVMALTAASAGGQATTAGLAVKDLSHSKIKRDGLPAGSQAPRFTLPDLAGTERSLDEFIGDTQALLVFSDPGCGPCQALSPELRRIHELHSRNGLAVVMVSRGDLGANQAKAEEHGLTFPVLIQPGWQVSRRYAMFKTPIAYLINGDGTIANDVAVGREAILSLITTRQLPLTHA